MTILDGGPAMNASAVISTMSGKKDDEEMLISSSTNMVTVKFISDANIHARGFQVISINLHTSP